MSETLFNHATIWPVGPLALESGDRAVAARGSAEGLDRARSRAGMGAHCAPERATRRHGHCLPEDPIIWDDRKEPAGYVHDLWLTVAGPDSESAPTS